MPDEVVSTRDRHPMPNKCRAGHFETRTYRFGPSQQPTFICPTHLVMDVKTATWPDIPRSLRPI